MSDSGKRREKRKVFLRITVFAIVAAVVIFGAGAAGKIAAEKKQNQMLNNSQQAEWSAENFVNDTNINTINVNGVDYVRKPNIEALLIMGVDSADTQESTESYRNYDQSDFNLLIVIDHDTQSYTSLALNRDTMCQVPALTVDGGSYYWVTEQLALAHTYGTGRQDSCEQQVWTVEELLFKEKIDHYVSFSMPAIGLANDAVGGVTVTIEDDFSDFDPTLKMGETIKLNNEQAEHYVRGRYAMKQSENTNRMSRQKTYMAAWKKLAVENLKTSDTFFYKLLGMVSDFMISDMNVNKLSQVANQLSDYTDYGVLDDLKGDYKRGEEFMEFYPDEDDLREKVLYLFYEPIGQ